MASDSESVVRSFRKIFDDAAGFAAMEYRQLFAQWQSPAGRVSISKRRPELAAKFEKMTIEDLEAGALLHAVGAGVAEVAAYVVTGGRASPETE